MLSPEVSVVSFDLWHTLIRSNGSEFRNQRNDLLRQAIRPDMLLEDFNALVAESDEEANLIAESRGHDVLHDERLGMICRAAGRPALQEAEIADLYERQGELFRQHPPMLLDPRTPELLKACSQGRKLAVVSNTGLIHGDQMRGALDAIGIGQSFDYLLFSNEVGYAKPDSRIFGRLLELSGVASHQVQHIGDNIAADIEGAKAMGMQAIHIPRGSILSDVLEVEEL